jgi:hypothetical protein
MRRAASAHHQPTHAATKAAGRSETTKTPRELASEPAAPAGGGRGRSRAHGRGSLLGAIATVFALIMLLSAVAPAPAQAGIHIPNPVSWIGGAVTGGIADMAVGAFDAIIKHLFAPITKLVTVDLIGWLIAIPNFTDGTHVASLETTVTAMGGGLLAAVATVAIARYWLIGYAGSGFAALEGLARTVAAAFALAMWPWAFGQAVHLTNLFTSSLLGADSVVKPCATMLAAALGAAITLGTNPLGLFLAIVIAIAALLLFLGLLLLKIAVSVSTILIFVGMPLAIVLWPVAPWVLGLVGRAFAACLAVPVLWALCFAAAAAVSLDSLTLSGGGAVINKVIQPLVALVLLYLMIKLPITLARIAMIGSQAISGGFVSRAVSYAAGRAVSNAASQHIPEAWGGTKKSDSNSSSAGEAKSGTGKSARTGQAAKTAAAGAAAAATGGVSVAATGTGAGAGVGAGAGAGADAREGARAGAAPTVPGYQRPPTAQARAGGAQGTQHGLPTPAFRKEDFDNEMYEAEHRQRNSPVSVQQARQALQSLPESTRQGVADAVSASSGNDGGRRELAYRATAGDWSSQQREAIRTLAAATPEVRSQALAAPDDDLAASGGVGAVGDQATGEKDPDLDVTPSQGSAGPPATPVSGGTAIESGGAGNGADGPANAVVRAGNGGDSAPPIEEPAAGFSGFDGPPETTCGSENRVGGSGAVSEAASAGNAGGSTPREQPAGGFSVAGDPPQTGGGELPPPRPPRGQDPESLGADR